MNQQELQQKAESYIAAEQHPFFRSQVEELLSKKDFDELSERFYKDLEFGTGGLRGIIAGGNNRLNPYTIKKATQGLADYLNSTDVENPSVAIAYDSRNYSDLFAEEAAKVLAANGIKAYLFTSLRPVPLLSFGVRELGTTAGIVITASHNPAQYNGYKVYWSDGCQVTPPHDTSIVALANKVTTINTMEKATALSEGKIEMVDAQVDDAYATMVEGLSLRPELIKEHGSDIKVVYTPLHGSGKVPVSSTLSSMGIDVVWVEEQKEPNGDFPTVKKPNPEEAEALTMAIALAKKEKADLILATDPDADRLGIAVPDANGEYVLITGNQLGALLADYIFSSRKALGTMPANPAFIKTIVTTNLQKKLAEAYGATSFDVLTGFKFIGEKIREFEADKSYDYLFGGEESYGYLIGTAVRDKDAVSAAVMTAEMTLFHRSEGRSLLEQLNTIWKEFGFFKELLINLDFEGQAGAAKIAEIMSNLRANIPAEVAGIKVVEVKDYASSTATVVATSASSAIDLPSANVLQFVLEDETIVTARPSGTEPKIKFYASTFAESEAAVDQKITIIEAGIRAIVQ